MTLQLRRKRQTTQPNTPAAKRSRTITFLLILSATSSFAPALLADDLSFVRTTVADGDQSVAASGSVLRLGTGDCVVSPAQPKPVHQEPRSGSVSVAPSATDLSLSKGLFSHAKWKGPTAVVPAESDTHGKCAYRAVRRSPVAADPGVVQAGAELPLDSLQPPSPPSPSEPNASDRLDSSTSNRSPAVGPSRPTSMTPATESGAAPLPTLEQQLATQPKVAETCILPRDLKSIRSITANINVKPEDLTGSKCLPPECTLGDTPFEPRHWRSVNFAWTAASTCHNPIYFDDEQLERYGHSWGPVKQTAVSAIEFFGTVPLLPYYMGVYSPNECIYDLGQYRPGSCAPYYLDPLPLSVRGALYEGTFLGLIPVAL